MAQSNFFPSRPNLIPQIYAYSDPQYENLTEYQTRCDDELPHLFHSEKYGDDHLCNGKERGGLYFFIRIVV